MNKYCKVLQRKKPSHYSLLGLGIQDLILINHVPVLVHACPTSTLRDYQILLSPFLNVPLSLLWLPVCHTQLSCAGPSFPAALPIELPCHPLPSEPMASGMELFTRFASVITEVIQACKNIPTLQQRESQPSSLLSGTTSRVQLAVGCTHENLLHPAAGDLGSLPKSMMCWWQQQRWWKRSGSAYLGSFERKFARSTSWIP